MLFDINCRLDMCRRQYANDACNRGTAGNFGWTEKRSIRWASHNPSPTHSLSLSLFYVHLFYVFFNVFFFCQQKISFFFHSKHTKIYFHTYIFDMCVINLFQKNYCLLFSLSNLLPLSRKNCFSDDLLLFYIQSALHLLSLCFSYANIKLYSTIKNPVNTSGISWQ